MSSLSQRPESPSVGLPVPHESAALHVTGQAMYTDDLAARTHGALIAWPVQSTHAHARVTIDVAGAYDVPGVVRVLTAEDVPGRNDAGVSDDEPLLPAEAMYHGHALVWVLAETAEAARRGAAAVAVEYEPLPSLITVREAIAAGSFQGEQRTVQRGDAASALATAGHSIAVQNFNQNLAVLLMLGAYALLLWANVPVQAIIVSFGVFVCAMIWLAKRRSEVNARKVDLHEMIGD